MLLADLIPPPDPASAHREVLLTWGLVLSVWLLGTGVSAVGGFAMVLRHAIDPPSRRTRPLGLLAAWANAVLAVGSVGLVFALRDQPDFQDFSVDLRTLSGLIAVVQMAFAVANGALVAKRPVVDPETQMPS